MLLKCLFVFKGGKCSPCSLISQWKALPSPETALRSCFAELCITESLEAGHTTEITTQNNSAQLNRAVIPTLTAELSSKDNSPPASLVLLVKGREDFWKGHSDV